MKRLMGPADLGYSGDAVPREYMAEAIRAYMADPNALKTVAPNTAARIRQYVNPGVLNHVVQFNSGSFAPAGVLTAQPSPNPLVGGYQLGT